MGRRPDRHRSRVLLIGAGRFRSSLLDDINAIGPGLEKLRRALTDPATGVFAEDREHFKVLQNPRTQRDVVDAFFAAAAAADDVLLIYYAGHGLLDRNGKLHLAVEESEPTQPIGNSVEFEKLKDELETSRATLRILILDCCFSGQALGRQAAAALDDDAVAAIEQVIDDDVAEGMYVLTSSDRQSKSRFVPGEGTTAFTGALLHALDARPDRELLLADLYTRISAELQRRKMPKPQTTAGNSAGQLVVRLPGPADQAVSPPDPIARGRRAAVAAVGVIAAVASAVAVGVAWSAGISAPPTATAAPTTAATPTIAAVADSAFTDDFSSPALDASKWRPPDQADVIQQANGHLTLSTRPGVGVDYARLRPIGLTRPFSEVRLTVVIPPYAQGGLGGGSLVLNPEGKQPQILALGPGADGGVIVAPLTCDRPSCRLAVYEDFTEHFPSPAPVKPGESVSVHILRKDNRLLFFSNGVQIGASEGDPGPLNSFWFAVSAGSEESWDVELDDLVVR